MWRKRMQDLSRRMGKSHAPLFAPLLFGVAAQIEAITVEQMRQDGTLIRKNVGELRRALDTDAVFCCAPDDNQLSCAVQTAGGVLESIPGLAAALDAVRQWQAQTDEPVILAAFHGPGRIFRWQREHAMTGNGVQGFEDIGHILAVWLRTFAEAGVHVVQWYDEQPQDSESVDAWKGVLGTIGNVARFHKVASVLLLDNPVQAAWPRQAVACPTYVQHPGAMPEPHARAWSANPGAWLSLSNKDADERLITTEAEVPADTEIAVLMSAMQRIRAG